MFNKQYAGIKNDIWELKDEILNDVGDLRSSISDDVDRKCRIARGLAETAIFVAAVNTYILWKIYVELAK